MECFRSRSSHCFYKLGQVGSSKKQLAQPNGSGRCCKVYSPAAKMWNSVDNGKQALFAHTELLHCDPHDQGLCNFVHQLLLLLEVRAVKPVQEKEE